jgi:hypothetical protein
MTSSPTRYADNARAAMTALMLNVMRERTSGTGATAGGFTSIDEVRATLDAFDLITQAMWWVLPCLEARVRDDFAAGRRHQDLSAESVGQFGVQQEAAQAALNKLRSHIAWMASIVATYRLHQL